MDEPEENRSRLGVWVHQTYQPESEGMAGHG